MDYRVISAMNNNVVLARDPRTDEQVVLMSKGIGFGRKPGDTVSDTGTDRQIFKLWTDGEAPQPLPMDHSEVEKVVRDVVRLAEEQLGVSNPRLYDALLDHIQFAIDRLRFGLPIENPFTHETAMLYTREFEVATTAVQMIQSRLQVDMGEAEIGFIALHLHSAGANGQIDRSMRSVQLYKQIMEELAAAQIGSQADRRTFLQWVFELIELVRRGVALHFPFPRETLGTLKESAALAERVRTLAERSCRLTFSDDAMGFLTLESEKLRQSSDKTP